MEKFHLALLVFCATIYIANSFQCYKCSGKVDEGYTNDECQKEDKKENCTEACLKVWGENTDGKEIVMKACVPKAACGSEGEYKKLCEDEAKLKEAGLKNCDALCCEEDLCNSAFTFSTNILVMMFAALCGVMLF